MAPRDERNQGSASRTSCLRWPMAAWMLPTARPRAPRWSRAVARTELLAEARYASASELDGTPEVTQKSRRAPRKSPPEVRVLASLQGEMSRRQLQDALALKDDEHFRTA